MTPTTETNVGRRRSTGCTSGRRRRRSGTRSPSPSGARGTATAAASSIDLRPGGAFRALASEEMRGTGRPGGGRRRRGDRGGPAAQARPDLAHASWTTSMAAEGFTRLTYEIEERADGVTKLTVIHDLEGAPKLANLRRRRVGERRRRRRLELGAQRPQVAARDRRPARLDLTGAVAQQFCAICGLREYCTPCGPTYTVLASAFGNASTSSPAVPLDKVMPTFTTTPPPL